MARHTLMQNTSAIALILMLVFIVVKMGVMNHYKLANKLKLFFFSLKSLNKPQISGFDNVAMRHYIRRSNLINKMFYVMLAGLALLYVIINAAVQR